jgi:hypothetical protein
VAPSARRRRASLALVLTASLALGATVGGVALQSAQSATVFQVRPDLRMSRPTSLRIQRSSSGRQLLRFTTTIVNVGTGRFELLAERKSTKTSQMTVRQRISMSNGTFRYVATGATARYAGDGHNHWHIRRVATYELVNAGGAAVRRDKKIGFCFFDTGVYDRSIHNFHNYRHYFERTCGRRASLSARMGISVGWSDTYGSGLAYQWIDVTGVVNGTYWLIATADKENNYLETNDRNNCSWAKIRLTKRAAAVTVLARGTGCTPPGVTPPPTPSAPPSASPSEPPSPSGSTAVTADLAVARVASVADGADSDLAVELLPGGGNERRIGEQFICRLGY